MKKYTQLTFVMLMMIFSGFQCGEDYINALSIVEGHVISCSDQNLEKIFVINGGNSYLTAVDTIFPDSEGFFTHQFTSIIPTFYLVPATQECSSVLAFIPPGKKTALDLTQTPLFQALEINFNIDPLLVDSLRIRIIGVNDVVNNEGLIVYSDPQNFDSGFTSQWDTIPTSFVLGEDRNYNMITEIFQKASSLSSKSEIIMIQNQAISRSISL